MILLWTVACADPPPADCATPGIVCTWAGLPGVAWAGMDGIAPGLTGLYYPVGVTVGPDGTPFLLDMNNHRLRSPDGNGMLQTVAGTGFSGVGGAGNAEDIDIGAPADAAITPDGDLFVVLRASNRVERFDTRSGQLEVIAGTGSRGFGGDGGPALDALFQAPQNIAVGADGVAYVSDTYNHVVRRIDPDGSITTLAGAVPPLGTLPSPGYEGDGGKAYGAKLSSPAGLHLVDQTLYLADSGNHVIRSIDLDSGTIALVAGVPGSEGEEDGSVSDARFSWPADIIEGPNGTLLIADEVNHCIRALDQGQVTTLAGTCGVSGYEGDGGPAADALFFNPHAITYDSGTLWVSDTLNQLVRTVPFDS